jgi:hypothetical protein
MIAAKIRKKSNKSGAFQILTVKLVKVQLPVIIRTAINLCRSESVGKDSRPPP